MLVDQPNNTYRLIEIENFREFNNNEYNNIMNNNENITISTNNNITTEDEFAQLITDKLLTRMKNIHIEKNTTCAICFDYIRKNNSLKTSCNHMFHEKCIKTWFKTSLCCPICRNKFRQKNNAN
jgi:hypothetical protein